MSESPSAAGLRALIGRLGPAKITNWTDSDQMESSEDPFPCRLEDANVITSKIVGPTHKHMLLIDIDHPAYLVRSSTPGHFHLYVEVPGGIDKRRYFNLLNALVDCGVIEHGYYKASMKRGYTTLRLPWIKKGTPEGGPARDE